MKHAMFSMLGTTMLFAVGVCPAAAQVTPADYERAQGLRDRTQYLTVHVPEPGTWSEGTSLYHYRVSVDGGHQFVTLDAATGRKQPAFDHGRLAASLSKATGDTHTERRLPFSTMRLIDEGKAIAFTFAQARWRCTLADYACQNVETAVAPGRLRGVSGPVREPDESAAGPPRRSPDGKLEALVRDHNIAVRPVGTTTLTALSTDGSAGNYYEHSSIVWSPDSTKLAAYRIRPGHRRYVHYVESSPEDQLQPKHWSLLYAKPGDALDLEQPVIFDVVQRTRLEIDAELFPNPFDLSSLVWRKDGRTLTFEYNERGHRVYRVIEVDAATGRARAVITESPETFFYYTQANSSHNAGKKFRHDLADGREIVWMSERDGWNHLYLYDGASGQVIRQITSGPWAVRGVEKVDEQSRHIWFTAGGLVPDNDPYFRQLYRINLDGSGLTPLTTADADHDIVFSPDKSLFVDTYSRVDLAPVSELRRVSDGTLVSAIERADISALVKSGWKPPEPFVARGRDGRTDIWGLIYRPSRFDPARRYPVIESIYAGPHGSHVPKSFSAFSPLQAQAELGFIVVQIDGMGTSNRSKAFQDVAWKNLGDAGFPDRILWHRAVAAKYPWYDISRVGIFGGSAGGQNALAALLFHPDFYKAAVSYAGCHDNRMDKIWWNELWMGWPLGSHYDSSSNVVNAHRLQGRLLLVVGELDTNVDPASTMQVVNALVRAGKDFELLVVPGGGHAAGRSGEQAAYGERRRFDFFVQHLTGQAAPDWNRAPRASTTEAARR
jgi:dipeptidyl aminopeptidase/acylaminoacyl peptidase